MHEKVVGADSHRIINTLQKWVSTVRHQLPCGDLLTLPERLDRALLPLHYFHCLYYMILEVHRESASLNELVTYVKRSLGIEALLSRLV